jgi:hypothetical protein
MLTTSHVPGTPTYSYIVDQMAVSLPPSPEQPPPLTWRYGQMRRWHKDFAFVYSLTNNPPACWISISQLRTQPTTPFNS